MGYTLRLVVNGFCNFKCFFCYKEGTDYPLASPISANDFINLVEAFSSLRPVDKIRLTGGEPLIYPELLHLLKQLKMRFPNVDIGLTTNASFPERILKLAQAFSYDPLHINISLPSVNSSNFHQMTKSDRFTQVMDSIKKLVAHGFSSSVSINFVYMPGVNDHELPDIVKFTQERSLRLKIIYLTVNEFNNEAIYANNITFPMEGQIEARLADFGYLNEEAKNKFQKGYHKIETVNCFSQQTFPYFAKFKTLRIYYDKRVGINGDSDNFIRPINMVNPTATFSELLSDVENQFENLEEMSSVPFPSHLVPANFLDL